MQNIPRWKKSDRGSSHFRHGLDPRLHCYGLPVWHAIIGTLQFTERQRDGNVLKQRVN